jgi:hypothetical protein
MYVHCFSSRMVQRIFFLAAIYKELYAVRVPDENESNNSKINSTTEENNHITWRYS